MALIPVVTLYQSPNNITLSVPAYCQRPFNAPIAILSCRAVDCCGRSRRSYIHTYMCGGTRLCFECGVLFEIYCGRWSVTYQVGCCYILRQLYWLYVQELQPLSSPYCHVVIIKCMVFSFRATLMRVSAATGRSLAYVCMFRLHRPRGRCVIVYRTLKTVPCTLTTEGNDIHASLKVGSTVR